MISMTRYHFISIVDVWEEAPRAGLSIPFLRAAARVDIQGSLPVRSDMVRKGWPRSVLSGNEFK
jgi:hypothetical protein